MSQCLANVSFSHPFSSRRICKGSNSSLYPRISYSLSLTSSRNVGCNGIKAMVGDGRDNLDHLKRQTKQPQQSQQSQQVRRRSPQVAPIGLWDRFPTARTVQQMMDTMESLMEDPSHTNPAANWSSSPLPSNNPGVYSRGRTPWEIKETRKDYKLRFDMPGMTKQDVKVWVEEKMLVLKAEKKIGDDENGENGEDGEEKWSAKSFGRYSYRIALPENVEFEKIKAEVKDGVLYISIPKADSVSKILDINVE